MKLLIITQKVDQKDQLLGFFIRWLSEFALKFPSVHVLCLEKGEYSLPSNVKVLSLGKDRGLSKIGIIFNFYKLIFSLKGDYDAVFIHMNPRYAVYGWLAWKFMGKKISLWYAHGHVSRMLRWAEKFSDVIFTSTPEGFRIKSSKVNVVGQGIDTDQFKPADVLPSDFKIISVGRISPSKDYETLIKAIELVAKEYPNIKVEVAGSPVVHGDQEYKDNLSRLLLEKKLSESFKFIGLVQNQNLPNFLKSASLFVNMSHTGSLDKAILEAMACGLPILTCNEALESVLGEHTKTLMYPKKNFVQLAEKIKIIIVMSQAERINLGNDLRKIVVENHGIEGLIKKIHKILLNESKA